MRLQHQPQPQPHCAAQAPVCGPAAAGCRARKCTVGRAAARPCAAFQPRTQPQQPRTQPQQQHNTSNTTNNWAQRLLAAGMAASVAATALLSPLTVPPAALAAAAAPSAATAMTMQHSSMDTKARPGTAAAEFSCTPLTAEERSTFIDLHGFHHKIRTSSPVAQALFDQGLLLTYNFNRPEAVNAFRAGLQIDPDAAMLHWGISHALGPYANKVWGPAPADGSFETLTPQEFEQAREEAEAGLAAARRALEQSASQDGSADAQQQLQLAQAELSYLTAESGLWSSVRSYDDPRITRALEVYAQAMESIGASYPSDPDPYGLAAEARMNISPWVHWQGALQWRRPVKANTVVTPVLRDIAEALRRSPGHPMAAHLMIHLTEAATPGVGLPAKPGYAALGEAAADSLAVNHPFPSMGHLSHMPGHTYIRLGRWHDAVAANQVALQSDTVIAKRCVQPYMPEHNSQQLIYSAMNTGQLRLALQQAQDAVDFPRQYGPTVMADGRERITKPLLQVRFAQWEPLLQQLSPSDISYSDDGIMVPPAAAAFGQGVFHYARALAFASAAAHAPAGGDAAQQFEQQMQREAELLSQAVADTPDDVVTRPGEGLGVPSAGFKHLGHMELLTVGARGDVLHGDLPAAASKLRAAIKIDSTLGYTEPPRQYQPLQECLGWVLLQQGKLQQAEQVYREDLAELPENPWALKGLEQVYARSKGRTAAAKHSEAVSRYAAAWKYADAGLDLPSSCPTFSE